MRLDTISCRGIVRPAVSDAFGHGSQYGFLPMDGDRGLSYPLPPHAPVDDKPPVFEDFFDFAPFVDGAPTSVKEPSFGSLVDSHVDLYDTPFCGLSPHSNSFPFPDGFDATLFDMQRDNGAALPCDVSLAADI
jgi:hypothetical protein